MFLEDKVTNYSRQTQTPQYGKIRDPNLDKGDFVFALAAAARRPAPLPSAAINPMMVEVELWNSVKDSGSAEELNAYLDQYPKGQFAAVARARLKGLSAAPQVALAAPSSVSSPRLGASFRDCDVCPEVVMIPPGSFMMGSPESEPGRFSDEGPQHQVTIARAFAAGKYEVTFDQWDACVREGGCSHNPGDSGWGRGRRPVINVSWDDAKQYVAWLSRKTGKTYRLLIEAEWEYVARAGTTTAFSFGNSISPGQANYNSSVSYAGSPTGTKEGRTVEVGRYPANAFGLHDTHGNVGEWVEDCWNSGYAGAPSDGSARTSGNCAQRMLRGGSWSYLPGLARSALRNDLNTSFRLKDYGFRVARTN